MPYPLSHLSLILSATTATPFKRPTVYPSIVQYSILVSVTIHPPHTSTGSLSLRLKNYFPRNVTSVSHSVSPTRDPSSFPAPFPSNMPSDEPKSAPIYDPRDPPIAKTSKLLSSLPSNKSSETLISDK